MNNFFHSYALPEHPQVGLEVGHNFLRWEEKGVIFLARFLRADTYPQLVLIANSSEKYRKA